MGQSIAYLPFSLPLLYLFPIAGSSDTFLVHSLVIIFVAIICLCFFDVTEAFHQLGRGRYYLGVYLCIVIVSTLLANNLQVGIIGIVGDYQGALLQLSAICIGLYVGQKILQREFIAIIANIATITCTLSILVDVSFLMQGVRLSGLLLHDTGMSLYAVISFGLNLTLFHDTNQLLKKGKSHNLRIYGMIISSLAVFLTASRIGLITYVLVIIFFAAVTHKRGVSYKIAGLLLVVLVCIPLVFSPARRLVNANKLRQGSSYRLQLYIWSIRQSSPRLIGLGSSQVYSVLVPNHSVPVPAVIKDTLSNGYPLWYTHNQFIDIYIQYGVSGLACFSGLVTLAITRMRQNYRSTKNSQGRELVRNTLVVGTLLITILGSLAVNTPSVDLWPMVWVALFSALILPYKGVVKPATSVKNG